LIGATAIEDRLQDGVPEAIAVLLKVIIFTVFLLTCWLPCGFSPKIGWSEDVGVNRR